MREWLGQARSFALGVLVMGAVFGCNSHHDGKNGGTSETHFLRSCTSTCEDGYSCLCGVCTLACENDATCRADAHATATCGGPSAGRNECGGTAKVCDVRCSSDGDCRYLGSDFECEAGRCRAPASTGGAGSSAGRGAGAGGRSGNAGSGTAGNGTAGSASPVMDAGTAPGRDAGSTCDLPAASGNCLAAIPRWYHDGPTGRCLQFTYGGCGGNENNFDTLEACEDACGSAPNACSLPPETGPCEALIPRWYHDSATDSCKQFTYGGCQGNANNFETLAACEAQCGGQTSVCALPPEVGPCDAAFRRYYHDPATGSCKQFTYGGCNGNANNFETLEACEAGCGGQPSGAACEVNGTVYPSGTDGIDDPTSCNTCLCDAGQLICTEINCPEPCPAGTTYSVSCSQCGPADGCEVLRSGCLPTCETSDDCKDDAPRSCFDGICRILCG